MPLRSALLGLAIAGPLLSAAATPSLAFTPEETSEIEGIVRDYLVRNPRVLLEALDALEEEQAAETRERQSEGIRQAGSELTETPAGTAFGNPEGDVTVVEFFDYNCGFCRRAHADMETLIGNDGELRFVLKEIPVLGRESEEASRVSLAVRQIAPERYGEFHDSLITIEGVADEASALAVAGRMGLDEAAVRGAMEGPEVAEALEESARLASLLEVGGTPAYVIGDELVPGAIGAEALASLIGNVRECGSARC